MTASTSRRSSARARDAPKQGRTSVSQIVKKVAFIGRGVASLSGTAAEVPRWSRRCRRQSCGVLLWQHRHLGTPGSSSRAIRVPHDVISAGHAGHLEPGLFQRPDDPLATYRTGPVASGHVEGERKLLRHAELGDQAFKRLAQVRDGSPAAVTPCRAFVIQP